MGAEQSSNRARLERENVEYILEQQRKLYEQRCRDLQDHVTAQNNARQATPTQRPATQPNLPRPATAAAPLQPQPPLTRPITTVHQPNNPSLVNLNRPATQPIPPRPATIPLQPQPPPTSATNTVLQPNNPSLARPAPEPIPPRTATTTTSVQAQPSSTLTNTVPQPNNPSLVNQARPASEPIPPRTATATTPVQPQPPPTRTNTTNNVLQPNNASLVNQARPASQPIPPRTATPTTPVQPQPPPTHTNNTISQPNNPSLVNQARPASEPITPRTATATTPVQPQPPPTRTNTTNNVLQPNNASLVNQARPASQPIPPRTATLTTPVQPQPPPTRTNTVSQPNNPSLVNQARPASQPIPPRTAMTPVQPQPPPTRTNTVVQPNKPSLVNLARFERNLAPYSFRREDLQNATEVQSRSNLYPNLNNNAPAAAGGPSTSAANFRFSNNVKPVAADFVFVNNNGTVRAAPSAPRERSVSRSRDRNSDNGDLKCPTCKNIFTLYIYNCGSGHSSCKVCKERRAACGVCGLAITDVRNHALESYVAERKVPCRNKGDGCALVIKLADMESHMKECPFKEMPCPLNAVLGKCLWRGKVNNIAGHFDNMHSAQRQAEEGQELFLPNICIEDKFVHLILKGAYNFLFHVFVSEKDRMIYMTTQLIGTKFSAQKWTYEIQIYNKREPRRKYQFVDVCSSSNEPINDIYKEARCATLPLSYAMNFVNEGAICYKFSIEKTIKGRSNFNNRNNRGRGRGGRHYS